MLDACSGIADTVYYVELYQFQYVVCCFEKTVYLTITIFDFLEYSLFHNQFSFCFSPYMKTSYMCKYGCFSASFVVQVTNFRSFMRLSMYGV